MFYFFGWVYIMLVSFKSLNENIHLGRAALSDVKKRYPYGFVSSSKYDTFSLYKNPEIRSNYSKRINQTRDIIDFQQKLGKDSFSATEYAIQKTAAANCGEQAVLVSKALEDRGVANEIISMNIYKNNSAYVVDGHSFCVIGLDDNADIAKPDTWGSEAVIVDLWSNTVDKASKAIKYFSRIFQISKKENNIKFYSVLPF